MKYIQEKNVLVEMGLSKKETDVFLLLLEKGQMTATEIARGVGKARTSVLLLLTQLERKGFLQKVKVKGHFEWEASSLDDIDSFVSEKFEMFKNTLPSFKSILKEQTLGKKFSVKICTGSGGLLKAYYTLLELKKGERIYFFEGSQSVSAKLKMRNKSMIQWQNAFKASGIIMEVIGSETSLHKVKASKGEEVLRSHNNRLMIAYTLPIHNIDFPCDIAVMPNTVILFMPKEEQAIIITSTDLALSLRKIFETLKMISTKVDINKMVEGLLLDKKS